MQSEELTALRENLREAWAALAMVRETVETLGPARAMQAREHLSDPTFMDEAEATWPGSESWLAKTTQANQLLAPAKRIDRGEKHKQGAAKYSR